ncbi:hypothetical protein TNCV_2712891 [Trichonephila clavipes]|uniref:Uncharacterized protein n=1 Tax=Trichonephila clavipes TaxID=2585209 RepID=A0A8X6V0D7_TRICX|nr:hypothetical protein TNCV_2712891 [Trichonephila clavipes]
MDQRGGRNFKKENFYDIDIEITHPPGSADTERGRRNFHGKKSCKFEEARATPGLTEKKETAVLKKRNGRHFRKNSSDIIEITNIAHTPSREEKRKFPLEKVTSSEKSRETPDSAEGKQTHPTEQTGGRNLEKKKF